ncbi:hypothetical protein A2U01_0084530, partial [Trifolium medium]|nr:hypothetical protein [Trifolium medium]
MELSQLIETEYARGDGLMEIVIAGSRNVLWFWISIHACNDRFPAMSVHNLYPPLAA